MLFFIIPVLLVITALAGGVWQFAGDYIIWYLVIGIVLVMIFGLKRTILFTYFRAAFFAGKRKGLVIDVVEKKTMSLKDWFYNENVYEVRDIYAGKRSDMDLMQKFDKEIIKFLKLGKIDNFKNKPWLFLTANEIDKKGGLDAVVANYLLSLKKEKEFKSSARKCF